VILEAKAVAAISTVFIAQTIIYLKVLGNKLGVLINFGEAQMKVKRLVLQLGREQRMEPRMTRIHG
jgi:GxxExxY protein